MNSLSYLYDTSGKKFQVVNIIVGTDQVICREVLFEKGTDNEILSNNVVTLLSSNLYSVPIESYQAKKIKELEKTLDNYRTEYDLKVREFRQKINGFTEINKDFFQVRKKILEFTKDGNDPFIKLLDFVTGNFKYAIVSGYEPELMKKDEFFEFMKRSDGMKGVIPNYASNDPSKRTLNLTSYSDGSGGYGSEIFLFSKYEKAFEKLKEIILKRANGNSGLSDHLIELATKNKIKLPKEKLDSYLEQIEKNSKNSIDTYNKSLDQVRKRLIDVEKLIENNDLL